jgi:hypothetical protein
MGVELENPAREKFSGNTFQAYLSGLEAMGLRAMVRAMVPPRVQWLMDEPPQPTAWFEGDELPFLYNAVMKLQGLEGVRTLGYAATRSAAGRFIQPLVRRTLANHGSNPGTLFTHLTSICRPFFEGLTFQFTPDGPRSGELRIRSATPQGIASWATWEGALRMLFDECGVTGVISAGTVSEQGRLATVKVRW